MWGGGQEHIWQVSQRLVKHHGISIDILAPNLGPESESYFDGKLKVLRIGPKFKFPSLVGRFLFLVSVLKFQILNSYDIYNSHASDAILLPITRLFKSEAKFVYTVHGAGTQLLGGGLFNRLNIPQKFWRFLVYDYLWDALLTAAKSTIKGKVASKNLVVLGNGVNFSDFDKVKRTKKDKKFTILWVGRKDDPIKGVRFLDQAFETLKKTHPNLSLNILTSTYGQDKIQAFKNADVFVLPSLSEGLSLALLEAMASKLPIVTTDVGDCGELVKKSEAGIVVPPGDADTIAEGIKQLYSKSDLKKLGQNGHDYAKKHYTWDKVTEKYILVFAK